MVTYKIVLLDHQWKADGTNFFRVRITHNRQSKFMKTNIVVTRDDVTKSGKVKTNSIISAVHDMEKKMIDVVNQLDTFELKSMSVGEVVDTIESLLAKPERFTLDFIDFGMKLAEKKSPGNATTYHVALNALLRFFNGRHPDISEITVKNLRSFAEFIMNENVVKVNWRTGEVKELNKKKGGRAASLYLSNIRHIYKSAREQFNEPDLGKFPIPVDPFDYFTMPKVPASQHKDIPPEVIQLMIDTRKKYEGRQRMAVDAFLISFGLCGINPADMYRCEKPKKNILHYYRQKTERRRDDRAEMWVKIHPCIREIMKDYTGKDRCFDYSERYATKDIFITALNQGLSLWKEKEKVKIDKLTFTAAARHTWGTIGSGKKCNIEERIITMGMCHKDQKRKVDNIYVKFDWEQLWDAQKVILDIFKWE